LSKDGKSSHSLNLADTMKLWPTPTAGDHSRNTVPPSIGKTRGYDLSMKVVEMEQKKQEQMWPTPNAWDGKRGPRSQKNLIEKNHQINLITAVKDAQSPTPTKMWPTPRSSNLMNQQMTPELANRNKGNLEEVVAERMWPTPAARDYKGGYIGGRYKDGKPNNNTLDTQVQFVSNQKKEQKQLSANWVTWLMGYPEGYLDISTENQNTSQELPKEKKTEPKS